MAMTFDPALTTTMDQVRYEITDIGSNVGQTPPAIVGAFLQDETIEALLDANNDNVLLASLSAARFIYRKLALVSPGKVGRFEVKFSPADAWAKIIKDLEIKLAKSGAAAPYCGGISVADKEARESDEDRVKPFFTRTLHDPPEIDFTPDPLINAP